MKTILLSFLMLCFSIIANAQDFTLVHHKVKLGETVKMISVKYKVDPSEIYKLNPQAVEGVSAGMVLNLYVPKPKEVFVAMEDIDVVKQEAPQIEVVEKKVEHKPTAKVSKPKKDVIEQQSVSDHIDTTAASATISHTVQAKETLYSLARLYNVTVDQIKSQNPLLNSKGLQIGQTITINPDKL